MLQVAIDVIDKLKAIQLAKEVVDGGADIVEAGTPLIKSCGIDIVREFSKEFKHKGIYILADTKTIDVPSIEVEIAAKAGADIITVLGVAEDSVIKEAIETANTYGIAVEIDLIAHPKPIERAKQVHSMGVDIVNLHVGISTQKRLGITAKDLLNLVSDLASTGIIVSVAGGIKPDEVEHFVTAGAKIVVIGSAITKASNPREATSIAKQNLIKSYRHSDL